VTRFVIAYLAAILLSSFGQVLMKTGANKTVNKGKLSMLANPFVLGGIGLFFFATLLNVYGLTGMPLKQGVAFLPLSYIFVGALSFLFFDERLDRRLLLGTFLIVCGAVISNL